MKLRLPLLALAAIAFVAALSLSAATTAVAETTPGLGATLGGARTSAYGPDENIVHLEDLSTFAWELHREVTGAAGQRIFAIYQDSFADVEGFIPVKYPANGRFVMDWQGEVEMPDRFVQMLSIGNNDWTEWSVGGRAKGRYNDDALIVLTERRNEVLHWWSYIQDWLQANKSALNCDATTKIINDEQAVRCTVANSLQTDKKIGLMESVGIFTDDPTRSISSFTFELWLTKNDNIPVRFDLAAAGVDSKNAAFGGRFELDIFDIESDDISIALPR